MVSEKIGGTTGSVRYSLERIVTQSRRTSDQALLPSKREQRNLERKRVRNEGKGDREKEGGERIGERATKENFLRRQRKGGSERR